LAGIREQVSTRGSSNITYIDFGPREHFPTSYQIVMGHTDLDMITIGDRPTYDRQY
jgi:hypothetical protein